MFLPRAKTKTRAATVYETHPWDDLVGIALDAVRLNPPLLVSSVLGMPWSWLPPHARYSEFGMLDVWRLGRTLNYLSAIWIPAIPRTPPTFGPPFLNGLFWEPSVILQRPDHTGNYTTFPDEAWFFLNGIMTNPAVSQLNAAYLSYLFHRPLTLIQNSTGGLIEDMTECALGKAWYRTTESTTKAFPPLYDALKDKRKTRVVLIAHSQGTIVAGVLLKLLSLISERGREASRDLAGGPAYAEPEFVYPDQEPLNLDDFESLTDAEIAKLEVYAFANCATRMEYVIPAEGEQPPRPWIESFGNEKDIVARLGMLAPHADKWGIHIDGPRYMRAHAWGHLLNQHYLLPIDRLQRRGRRRGGQGDSAPYTLLNENVFPDGESPRLFSYINGGVPLDEAGAG